MPELSHQEIFDNEGHINYDKVVEIVHLNLKNFLNAILEESFSLAKQMIATELKSMRPIKKCATSFGCFFRKKTYRNFRILC